MARQPFDPSLARGGLFDQQPPEAAPISVTQASAIIRRAVESTGRQRIVGEVSNLTQRNHWYFTIKDAESQLDCVMWASANARCTVAPANGMEVVVTGEATHWGPRGRTQLVVSRIERRGTGTLQQRFDELCSELRAQGYFDEERKRPLPAHPRAIAVVTSGTGAALQDVLRTARLRAPFVRIVAVDVPVQGDAAAPAVARAVAALDRRAGELGIDAVIVTRGGGSLEDLWAFNERAVADAVFRARIPIVAAVGHETDTTVVELVADRRASTPTAAVMLLLPDREAMEQQSSHLEGRLRSMIARRLETLRRDLASAARHPALRSPAALLAPRQAAIDRLRIRLSAGGRGCFASAHRRLADAAARFERHRPSARHAEARERLRSLTAALDAVVRRGIDARARRAAHGERQLRLLGPQETLARGWSITFAADGTLLRRAADVRPGTEVVTQLVDGSVRSRVEAVRVAEQAAPPRGDGAVG